MSGSRYLYEAHPLAAFVVQTFSAYGFSPTSPEAVSDLVPDGNIEQPYNAIFDAHFSPANIGEEYAFGPQNWNTLIIKSSGSDGLALYSPLLYTDDELSESLNTIERGEPQVIYCDSVDPGLDAHAFVLVIQKNISGAYECAIGNRGGDSDDKPGLTFYQFDSTPNIEVLRNALSTDRKHWVTHESICKRLGLQSKPSRRWVMSTQHWGDCVKQSHNLAAAACELFKGTSLEQAKVNKFLWRHRQRELMMGLAFNELTKPEISKENRKIWLDVIRNIAISIHKNLRKSSSRSPWHHMKIEHWEALRSKFQTLVISSSLKESLTNLLRTTSSVRTDSLFREGMRTGDFTGYFYALVDIQNCLAAVKGRPEEERALGNRKFEIMWPYLAMSPDQQYELSMQLFKFWGNHDQSEVNLRAFNNLFSSLPAIEFWWSKLTFTEAKQAYYLDERIQAEARSSVDIYGAVSSVLTVYKKQKRLPGIRGNYIMIKKALSAATDQRAREKFGLSEVGAKSLLLACCRDCLLDPKSRLMKELMREALGLKKEDLELCSANTADIFKTLQTETTPEGAGLEATAASA